MRPRSAEECAAWEPRRNGCARGRARGRIARAACATVLVLVALSTTSAAQLSRADADQLQRKAVDRWVARDFAEADRLYGEAIAAFDAIGDREWTANCLSNRALVRLNLERWDAAAADARRADGLYAAAISELDPGAPGASDTNSPLNLARRGRAGALGALRAAAVGRGRLAEAERYQRSQLELWEAVGDENPAGLASGYEALAEIVEAAGRHAEAAEHYDRAAQLWKRSSEVYASDFVEQRRLASLAGARAARQRAASPAGDAGERSEPSTEVAAAEAAPATESEGAESSESDSVAESTAEAAGAPESEAESEGATPAVTADEPRTGPDIERIIQRAVAAVAPILGPLVFGAVILLVLVNRARQVKQMRKATIEHRATQALRKARPTIAETAGQLAKAAEGSARALPLRELAKTAEGGTPALLRELAARTKSGAGAAAATTSHDPPPPVVGGPSRTVIEHKGFGWCGCMALVAVVAALLVAVPWLLRTFDVL